MSLEILEVVEAVLVLHDESEIILSIVIYEVSLAAFEDVVYAFECHGEHLNILKLEH
jgi:hypothetical protein